MLATIDDPDLSEIYTSADWMSDPTVPDRSDDSLYPWLLSRSKQEVTEAAQANRWAVTPVNQPRDVVEDVHFGARGGPRPQKSFLGGAYAAAVSTESAEIMARMGGRHPYRSAEALEDSA